MRRPFLRFVLLPAFLLAATWVGAATSVGRSVPTRPPADALPGTQGLPDPFLGPDGVRIRTRDAWERRRAELRETMVREVYGRAPRGPFEVRALEVVRRARDGGRSVESTFTLEILGGIRSFRMRCGTVMPAAGGPRHPVVLVIDPVWQPHVAATARLLNDRGYGMAGFVYHDVDDDDPDRSDGVQACFPGGTNDWATLAAWAWAASRLADHLSLLPEVDPGRLVVAGHSRCGKAALLAGALDERFRLTVPHASGAGGAGSFRIQPKGVETLDLITDPRRFGHWFVPGIRAFVGMESGMPFDQHFLKALVAPRALATLEAEEDRWANPEGTWQTHLAAREVFRFLGADPAIRCGIRPGGHDPVAADWIALADVADAVFLGRPMPAGNGFRWDREPGVEPAFDWRAP